MRPLSVAYFLLKGFNPDRVLDCVRLSIEEFQSGRAGLLPADYAIDSTSWRVLKLIIGNTGLSNLWDGINAKT
nr:hypothetical protein [Bacteroidota bacterium]